MSYELTNLSTRLSELRRDCREHFGGIRWTPISHEFGIYKMNIPEKEDFMSFAEHHFVELEKLFFALSSGEYSKNEGNHG